MVLNYPVGDLKQAGVLLSKTNPVFLFSDLMDTNFSGFVVLTIEGFSGIEEALVFFREGNLVGSVYSYDRPDIAVFSKTALDSSFNAFLAKHGVLDVIALSRQQIDLIFALDERIGIPVGFQKSALQASLTGQFSEAFGQKALNASPSESASRHDLLKRLGLSELIR